MRQLHAAAGFAIDRLEGDGIKINSSASWRTPICCAVGSCTASTTEAKALACLHKWSLLPLVLRCWLLNYNVYYRIFFSRHACISRAKNAKRTYNATLCLSMLQSVFFVACLFVLCCWLHLFIFFQIHFYNNRFRLQKNKVVQVCWLTKSMT
jgi:hypothetical protein